MPIQYNRVIDLITSEFQEMKIAYESDLDEYADGDEHNCYAFCSVEFVPFIMNNLRQNNTLQLKKIFALVENLFTNGDERTINLANVGITEDIYLEADFDTYKPLIYELCGKQTKESFEYWESGVHWQNGEQEKS